MKYNEKEQDSIFDPLPKKTTVWYFKGDCMETVTKACRKFAMTMNVKERKPDSLRYRERIAFGLALQCSHHWYYETQSQPTQSTSLPFDRRQCRCCTWLICWWLQTQSQKMTRFSAVKRSVAPLTVLVELWVLRAHWENAHTCASTRAVWIMMSSEFRTKTVSWGLQGAHTVNQMQARLT